MLLQLLIVRHLLSSMRIKITKVAVKMFEKEMGTLRSSTKNTVKMFKFEEGEDCAEVFRLGLIEANTAHEKDDKFIPISLNIIEEEAVIIADSDSEMVVKNLKKFFNDKANLTG